MINMISKVANVSKMTNVDIFENNNKIFMFAEDTIDDEKLHKINNKLESMGLYFDKINIKMATLREIEKI